MTSLCRRLLQRLAFRESRHFGWDKDPANTMVRRLVTDPNSPKFGPIWDELRTKWYVNIVFFKITLSKYHFQIYLNRSEHSEGKKSIIESPRTSY